MDTHRALIAWAVLGGIAASAAASGPEQAKDANQPPVGVRGRVGCLRGAREVQ